MVCGVAFIRSCFNNDAFFFLISVKTGPSVADAAMGRIGQYPKS